MTDWLNVAKECAEEVMKELGSYFTETAYHQALGHEFRLRDIPYERGRTVEVFYKGYSLSVLITDCILNPSWHLKKEKGGEFLLELKDGSKIDKSHIRQAQVYLASLNIDKGAVLNFNTTHERIDVERVNRPDRKWEKKVKPPAKKLKSFNTKSEIYSAAKEVLDFLGSEFFYSTTGTSLYFKAIGVELRLRGIPFQSVTKAILYKGQIVESHTYEYVLDNGDAVNIIAMKSEKDLENKLEELKAFKKHSGAAKNFLLALPQKDGEAVIVREV